MGLLRFPIPEEMPQSRALLFLMRIHKALADMSFAVLQEVLQRGWLDTRYHTSTALKALLRLRHRR
jgi:hypothetical protein